MRTIKAKAKKAEQRTVVELQETPVMETGITRTRAHTVARNDAWRDGGMEGVRSDGRTDKWTAGTRRHNSHVGTFNCARARQEQEIGQSCC